MNNNARQVIVNASAHSIPLPDGMIHTVVTSPPYYSLRRYSGEQEVHWPTVSYSPMPGLPPLDVEPMRCALGLEPTPEAYIGHLVLCFREVWRTLRDDGTAWIVMGDSYNEGRKKPGRNDIEKMYGKANALQQPGRQFPKQPRCSVCGRWMRYNDKIDEWYCDHSPKTYHQGDLMLIPHRLALALQGDGWIVRNDVVWAKVAPMPESVSGWTWQRCRVKVASGIYHSAHRSGHPGRDDANVGGGERVSPSGGLAGPNRNDTATKWTPCPGCPKCEATGGYVLRRGSWRHTRAHETVLMLAKGMGYFADQERVREPCVEPWGGKQEGVAPSKKDHHLTSQSAIRQGTGRLGTGNPSDGRNPRSVLTPKPESYGRAHYAVFPSSLIGPLLRATAPTRCCPVCGAPWCPVVERGESMWEQRKANGAPMRAGDVDGGRSLGHVEPSFSGAVLAAWKTEHPDQVLGHRPTCDHDAEPVPGWVLDNFVGSGTTLAVCRELGVNGVGIDLSPEYLDRHAKIRASIGTPSNALEGLPLFEGMDV